MTPFDTPSGGFRTVVDSAESLLQALDRPGAAIDYAVGRLCQAADELSSIGSGRFAFETADPSREPVAVSPEEALSEAAVQARLAQLLFAASKAVGEDATDDDRASPLREVVQLARTDFQTPEGSEPLAFESSQLTAARDLADAVEAFRREAESALDTIIDHCERTISQTVSAIVDRKDALLDAIGSVAQQLSTAACRPSVTFSNCCAGPGTGWWPLSNRWRRSSVACRWTT